MDNGKSSSDAVTGGTCDPQDAEQRNVIDTASGEEEKLTCATGESKLVREIPSLQELEEILHSAPRSCRHGDEVWPNLILGDM